MSEIKQQVVKQLRKTNPRQEKASKIALSSARLMGISIIITAPVVIAGLVANLTVPSARNWTIAHAEPLKMAAELYGAILGVLLVIAAGAALSARYQKSKKNPDYEGFIIRTRHDISQSDIQAFQNKNQESKESRSLAAYAPAWVMTELEKIWPEFAGKSFQVVDRDGKLIEILIIPSAPSLKYLQILARNESANPNGVIKSHYYNNYQGISKEAVLSLKDLAKHCIFIAKTQAVAEGGYGNFQITYKQPKEVFMIDLIGAQFQKPEHYGRNLIIPETSFPSGKDSIDIYQQITGHKRPSFVHIKNQIAEGDNNYLARYRLHYWECWSEEQRKFVKIPVYFDTYAYQQMVSQDFYLSAVAANTLAEKHKKEIDFRFLSYGTGCFAGDFKQILEDNILEGILKGLEKLDEKKGSFPAHIKRLTFPFYSGYRKQQKNKIVEFCNNHGMECVFNEEDALHQVKNDRLTIALTNAADPHVVLANEGGNPKKGGHPTSVDAALGCNLADYGMGFDPKYVTPSETLIAIPPSAPPKAFDGMIGMEEEKRSSFGL